MSDTETGESAKAPAVKISGAVSPPAMARASNKPVTMPGAAVFSVTLRRA